MGRQRKFVIDGVISMNKVYYEVSYKKNGKDWVYHVILDDDNTKEWAREFIQKQKPDDNTITLDNIHLDDPIVISESVNESKEDEAKFRSFAGDKLADKFYELKPRIKSPKNDIYYWMKKDVKELEDFLDDLSSTKTVKQREQSAREGAEKIYSDENWDVFKINTFEASKKYGANTKWCITGKESGWIDGDKPENIHWKSYTENGIKFYFYIDKKNNKKYALAVYPNGLHELFDETDRNIKGIQDAPIVDGLPDIRLSDFVINFGVLTKYTGNSSVVIVPDGVLTIGDAVFAEKDFIKEIILPDGLKRIKNSAFIECINLESISIPDSVNRIGNSAFDECGSLRHIKLPDLLIEISSGMFYGAGLLDITIPYGVTAIRVDAFRWCSSLRHIEIPNTVTYIGEDAFQHCPNLKSVKYNGTEEEWNQISTQDEFGFGNENDLKNIIPKQASITFME